MFLSQMIIIVSSVASPHTHVTPQNESNTILCQFGDMEQIISDDNSTIDRECCVCLEETWSSLNESEFQRIFGFCCVHSSNNVCLDCWTNLLYRHGNRTKCPLCRACKPSETGPNLPYGLEEDDDIGARPRNAVIQPGYVARNDEDVCQRILRPFDIDNGIVALFVRQSFNLLHFVTASWLECIFESDVFTYILCCPLFVTSTMCLSTGVYVTDCACLSCTLCCCMDCCHVCFPELHWREYCLKKINKCSGKA